MRRLPHALEAIDATTSLPRVRDEFVRGRGADDRSGVHRLVADRAAPARARRRRSSCTARTAVWSAASRSTCPSTRLTEYRGGSCDRLGAVRGGLAVRLDACATCCARAARSASTAGASAASSCARRLDYRALPFASSPNPYLESLMPRRRRRAERRVRQRRRVRLLRLEPRAALRLGHQRLAARRQRVRDGWSQSREPFWERVVRDGDAFRVYFFNDRGGIYALGYPVVTWLGHLINLGELRVLLRRRSTPCCWSAATLFNALTLADARQRPRAAARGALELLSQAVHRVRRVGRRAGRRAGRSRRAPTSRTSSGPASRRRR